MAAQPNIHLLASLKFFSKAASVCSILVGCLVLLGWIANIKTFKSVFHGFPEMTVTAALSFTLAGLSLLFLDMEQGGRWTIRIARVCSFIIVLIGLITLIQYIDQTMSHKFQRLAMVDNPGRMALPSAINFIILGLALILLNFRLRYHSLIQTLGLLSAFVGFVILLGYIYSFYLLYKLHIYNPPALPSALVFILLGLGIMSARPNHGFMGIIASDSAGGFISRRILPLAIGFPIILGWLTLESQNTELYGIEFGMALQVTLFTVIFTTAILLIAVKLNRADAERKQGEDAIKENLNQLSKMNRYETIIGTVTRSAHHSINPQEVMENAVDAISTNIDGVENISIFLVEGEEAILKSYRGYPDWWVKRVGRIPYPQGFTWKTIIEGKPRYVADAEKDTVIGPAVKELGTKSYLSMPIHFEGKTVGCININSLEKNAFDEEELKLLEIVARQVEVAINNAQRTKALQSSEERYRALYEDNPSMYFTVDTNGTVLSVNLSGAEQLGYTAQELVGQSVLSVFYSDDQKSVLELLSRCLEYPGQIFQREFRKVCKNGSILWTRESARTVPDADGSLVIFIVYEDITERKLVELEIKRLNKELEQRILERTAQLEATNTELEAFTYSVSHDLRAPLRHIAGFTDLLNKNASSNLDERNHRYLMMISESVKKMGDLIEDLLAFSQLGRSAMQKTKISLERLVQEVLHDFGEETDGRNILWKIDLLPEVYADLSMLRVVLVNLVSNAVKFTSTRSQAEIEIGCTSGKENEIVVFVRDNGVGLDMKYAHKLFNVFQRLHHADKFEGIGIGLATVRRIIHRQGGQTWAEGSIDGGATFYFSLPKS